MRFSSERLGFKEFTEEDFPLFCSVFTNEQVMQYAYLDRFRSDEDCRDYFNSVLQNSKAGESRPKYEFAVYTIPDERFVGFAHIEINMVNASGGIGEVGYFLLPGFWGKGYATEIAKALIGFCFTELHLHRVQAHCNSNNTRSENVMKKAGMTKEGEFRAVRFKQHRWDNEKCYGILKEEWDPITGCCS